MKVIHIFLSDCRQVSLLLKSEFERTRWFINVRAKAHVRSFKVFGEGHIKY